MMLEEVKKNSKDYLTETYDVFKYLTEAIMWTDDKI